MPTAEDPAPFRGFLTELLTVIPPFTLIGAAKRGWRALCLTLLVFALALSAARGMTLWLDSGAGMILPAISDKFPALTDQWLLLGIGYYVVFCWAAALRNRDLPT